MDTDQMVLEHLAIIEKVLGQLEMDIECSLELIPNGAIIHKEHSLEVIQHAAISAWAIRDLIEHREEDKDEDDEEKGKDIHE